LVEHTSQRPDVAFGVVGKFRPNLGTGVIGSAGLGGCHSAPADFADVQIGQPYLSVVFGEEDVGTLDVSVEDVAPVQGCQGAKHLDSHTPDLGLRDKLSALLKGFDVC